jgi:hypothetical protein
MPFSIRPYRRFAVHCSVTYNVGPFQGQGTVWNLSCTGWRLSGGQPRSLRFTIAVVLSIVCLAVPAWADGQTGVDAYTRGDYATAEREWRPLAKQGNAAAQCNLGVLYDKGQGGPQDYAIALQWYEKAAAKGVAKAQFYLGRLYAYGEGIPQDLVKAQMWYSLAARTGYETATGYRDDLAKQMTPAQIAEAHKLAQEWTPKAK